MEKKPANTLVNYLLLCVLMLIWGSSFILMKKGLISFTGFQLGALRISISFFVLLPFAVMRISKVWHQHRKSLLYFFLAGFLGNGIPAFLFAIAQTRIDSLLAGILNSLTPLFTVIVGVSLFGAKTRWANIAGVLTGLAGAIGLMMASSGQGFSINSAYGLLIVAATVLYAFNLNIIKRFLSAFDAVTITSVAFLSFAIPFVIYLFTTDFIIRMETMPQAWNSLGYIALLSVLGTAMAVILQNWLIKQTSPLFVASVTYLIPIVAIFWGIVDGERFDAVYIFWVGLILAGVYLANRPDGGFIKKRLGKKKY